MRRLLMTLAAFVAFGAQAQSTDGEVKKVDKAQGKITLKHGEIKALEMPPMTMSYRVKNPAVLDTLAVGDRVRFDAEKADGSYTVTTIVKQP
jgi:Cu/Ag efflux protein CusF